MWRKFYKMHGIGNDYIYFDCMKEELKDVENLSIRLSDRHFSIGGDGIILLLPSKVADCKMRIFNADGSEAMMCGNGVRCVGKLAHDLGYVKGSSCLVETLSGIKKLDFTLDENQRVSHVRVDMGAAILEGKQIPSTLSGRVIRHPLKVGDKEVEVTLVSMGNPHCVVFAQSDLFDDPDSLALEKIGPLFENNEVFPNRVNTEFIKVVGRNHLKMRVWERGSGETWACGTGACASAVASVLNGYCDKNTPILINLKGGDLAITYTDSTVIMEGPATLAFVGEVEI
jgi:diaminopimelate epimerase